MLVRTALLCIPEEDEEAVAAVLQLLRSQLPTLLLMHTVAAPSQQNWLEEILRQWCDEEEIDLILTIGGTRPAPGPSGAEVVPRATLSVLDRPLDGLAQAMRAYAAEQTPLAWLDGCVAGIRGRTLILNLPAGAAPAQLFLDGVIDLVEPLLLHLQEAATAPTLADELEGTPTAPFSTAAGEDAAEEPTSPTTKAPSASGLKADEFAAFLERKRNTPL